MFWHCTGFRIAVFVLAVSNAWGQVTSRVSVDSAGNPGNGVSGSAVISNDGRWVVFESRADNLVPADVNGNQDVFVHDRWTGTTECVSVNSSGALGNDYSYASSISADGRYVGFWSYASNLVPGDTNDFGDVFVRDLWNGTTEILSVDVNGIHGDGDSMGPALSDDGRYAVFVSRAVNLVPGGSNGYEQVYLRDTQNGTIDLVSISTSGALAAFDANGGSVSADGRRVVFQSMATNLVPGDTNGENDIFVRDLQAGTTARVNVATDGTQAAGFSVQCTISSDGRIVAFWSSAPNLVSGDTNGSADVFVRDLQNSTTERVNLNSNGAQTYGDALIYAGLSVSADGRCVAFVSAANNLCLGDTNSLRDIFVRDRQLGTTERASVNSGGGQALGGHSYGASLSGDGRFVAFASASTNMVPWDTNGIYDVFVRDRLPGAGTTAFTSVCEPGSDGVVACPCGNSAAGAGSGCDNSAATGGAILTATGITGVTTDGLVFHTSGEPLNALSVLAQGNAFLPSGAVYGQGVRCVAGTVKRLYSRSAAGGSLVIPNLPGGDVPVSVRSAAKGDRIQAGESRWYFVFYRDPTVLGGCPASSTFNATQTGRVDWSF